MTAPDQLLVAELAELGSALDYPTAPDLVATVTARIATQAVPAPRHPHPAWRAAFAVALVLAFVLVIGSLIPAVRDQVAAWLGIGGVEIENVDEVPEGLGEGLPLGESVSMEVAETALGRPLLVPAALGTPDLTFLMADGRGVSMVWRQGPDLPGTAAGVGAVLTQFPGGVDEPLVRKLADPAVVVEAADVDGRPAFWITGGPHPVFYLGLDGEVLEDTGRLAGNTLLWQAGSTTLRLESGLGKVGAVAIAESVG